MSRYYSVLVITVVVITGLHCNTKSKRVRAQLYHVNLLLLAMMDSVILFTEAYFCAYSSLSVRAK